MVVADFHSNLSGIGFSCAVTTDSFLVWPYLGKMLFPKFMFHDQMLKGVAEWLALLVPPQGSAVQIPLSW